MEIEFDSQQMKLNTCIVLDETMIRNLVIRKFWKLGRDLKSVWEPYIFPQNEDSSDETLFNLNSKYSIER